LNPVIHKNYQSDDNRGVKGSACGQTIENQLREIVSLFPGKHCSLQVSEWKIRLFHISFSKMIFLLKLPLSIPGDYFPDLQVFNETIKKYHKEINVYFPDHEAVEDMVTEKGPLVFIIHRRTDWSAAG